MVEDVLKYSVGALLYCPALNTTVADSILSNKFGEKYSLCLCAEDTIAENAIEQALNQIELTFKKLYLSCEKSNKKLPNIFIRVRNPEQIEKIFQRVSVYDSILKGFAFPKYSSLTAEKYNDYFLHVSENTNHDLFMMPILESQDIVDYQSRYKALGTIKKHIDDMKKYVVNVRVGGNDFCNYFGVRRHVDQTIYDISPINSILSDILTFFSQEYVVSGPVWEYYSDQNDNWKNGLQNELKYDLLNGFIGKTVIHPKQISVVNDALKVDKLDYLDAKEILNWKKENSILVHGSVFKERMNERKTHYYWAKKIMFLSKCYGIKK